MIYYLVTPGHVHHVRPLIAYWAQDINAWFKVLTYESFLARTRLDPGTYIFSDIERLTPHQKTECARVWSSLGAGQGFRSLNHPTRSFGRYQLLKTLHAKGINQFRAYRFSECQTPKTFPVFARRENEHRLLFPLLHSQDELDRARAKLNGHLDGILLIEFCDTSDSQGVFRKYSAYCVGRRVIPIHIMFSDTWFVKNSTSDNKQAEAEEWEFITGNPHKKEISRVFRMAGIEYGRIDYGLLEGRIQVWEINTNPAVLPLSSRHTRFALKQYFLRQFCPALAELNADPPQAPNVNYYPANHRALIEADERFAALIRAEHRIAQNALEAAEEALTVERAKKRAAKKAASNLRASTSWRVTAPARVVANHLRSLLPKRKSSRPR